jgi:hypothetical protein
MHPLTKGGDSPGFNGNAERSVDSGEHVVLPPLGIYRADLQGPWFIFASVLSLCGNHDGFSSDMEFFIVRKEKCSSPFAA